MQENSTYSINDLSSHITLASSNNRKIYRGNKIQNVSDSLPLYDDM